MSKNSNDNIEDFFRKGLSQQESPFIEEDWKKMEKLLNAHEAGRSAAVISNTAKILMSTAILLLLFTSTYWWLKATDNTERNSKELSTKDQAALGAKALESKDGNPDASLILDDKKESFDAKEKINADIASNEQPAFIAKNPKASQSETFFKKKERESSNDFVSTSKSTGITRTSSEVFESSKDATDPLSEQTNSANQTLITRENAVLTAPVIEPDVADSVAEIKMEKAKTVKGNTDENQEKNKSNISGRFSIAAVISPDYSSTEMANFSSPGKSYGLLIGFNVFKRLSISSGLFRSSKLYTGYGSDYQPPAGYWERRTNGVVPDEINGNCQVWEIPLVIRYDIIQRPKSRVYSALGVTSYLITSERYAYCFNSPNPGAASGWSTEKSTSYPFDVGYFSVGYEHNLTRHLSLGIEPFMKIPFRGMGWSNVNIYSTGAYFTVRYRFLKNIANH